MVEIQRGMQERNADVPKEKRIDFRFGVNVGDVIVDGDDIDGDGGVNVTRFARLGDLAEPGGVLVAGVVPAISWAASLASASMIWAIAKSRIFPARSAPIALN